MDRASEEQLLWERLFQGRGCPSLHLGRTGQLDQPGTTTPSADPAPALRLLTTKQPCTSQPGPNRTQREVLCPSPLVTALATVS